MRELVLIAHNLRSAHNVGSLLRTADGLGVKEVWLTGHTPYPVLKEDGRMPHIAAKVNAKIAKTSLGAEKNVDVKQSDDIFSVLSGLKSNGYAIAALEQAAASILLPEYAPPDKIAVVVGREVEGVEPEVLKICGLALEIPMLGQKESFNVAVAAGMALYALRFAP